MQRLGKIMKQSGWLVLFLLTLTTFLAGCARHHKDAYLDAAPVHPLVIPPGIRFSADQHYYPLPNSALLMAAHDRPPPSLIPPDSQILVYQEEAKVYHKRRRPVLLPVNLIDHGRALQVAAPVPTVWPKVKKALLASGYEILDQDKRLLTYYVLDATVSLGQLDAKTPLYRIYLSPEQNVTVISVTDQANRPLSAKKTTTVLNRLAQHLG